jgi:hypothetical protein
VARASVVPGFRKPAKLGQPFSCRVQLAACSRYQSWANPGMRIPSAACRRLIDSTASKPTLSADPLQPILFSRPSSADHLQPTLARSPFDSPSLSLGARSGQALDRLVKTRAFGMTPLEKRKSKLAPFDFAQGRLCPHRIREGKDRHPHRDRSPPLPTPQRVGHSRCSPVKIRVKFPTLAAKNAARMGHPHYRLPNGWATFYVGRTEVSRFCTGIKAS